MKSHRRNAAPLREYAIPAAIVALSIVSQDKALERNGYALAGAVLLGTAAWTALVLWRRGGLGIVLKRRLRQLARHRNVPVLTDEVVEQS